MGIGGLGMWEIVLIFMVVLLLFGAKRLPEIGSALGKGIREFKGSVREIENELRVPDDRRSVQGSSPASQERSESRSLRAEEPRKVEAERVEEEAVERREPTQGS